MTLMDNKYNQSFQFSSNSRKFLEFRLTTHSMRIFLEFVPSRKFDSEEFLGSLHKSRITLQNSSNDKILLLFFLMIQIYLRFALFDMLFSKFPTDPRIIIGYFPPFIKRPQFFFLKFCNQEFLINHEYFV